MLSVRWMQTQPAAAIGQMRVSVTRGRRGPDVSSDRFEEERSPLEKAAETGLTCLEERVVEASSPVERGSQGEREREREEQGSTSSQNLRAFRLLFR